MVEFQNDCWSWAMKIFTIKISGTVQTFTPATLFIANFMQTLSQWRTQIFLRFRACFKASVFIDAEIHRAHVKCRCLVSLSLNHPCKSVGLLFVRGSYFRPFANRVQNDWESKFQPLPSVKLRIYNSSVLLDGYFGLPHPQWPSSCIFQNQSVEVQPFWPSQH